MNAVSTPLRKRQAIIGPGISGSLLTFAFMIALAGGVLVLDNYQFAILNRRLNNYALIASQRVAAYTHISDDNNFQTTDTTDTYYLSQSRTQELCEDAYRRFVDPSIRNPRTTWLTPIRIPSPTQSDRMRCAIVDDRTVEVVIYMPFAGFTPFFSGLEAFGHSRVRLWAGINYPTDP